MAIKIKGDHVRRAGWLLLVGLFLLTALGIGLISFWQSTHQSSLNAATNQTAAQACTLGVTEGAETLPTPDMFKETAKTSQLQSTDLVAGAGDTLKSGDCAVMKYYGTLASNGTMFDEDFSKTEGLKVPIGAGQVIPGWDQGLPGMKVGGTRRLVIPAALGYGSQAEGTIPANSDLVFVVKLESISK